MRTRAHIALLLPLACLIGCALPYTPPSSITGNWQIQSGSAITSPPTGTYLIGALQGSDAALTGTFNMQQPGSGVTPQVISLTGTYNPNTSNLILGPPPPQVGGISVMLSVPADPTDPATGSIDFFCGVCANGFSLPAVGVQIAPLNGTYTGILTESASTIASPIPSGPVTLALTQSSTPNTDGSFPLTGMFSFRGGGCESDLPLNGTVSGEGITLNWPSPAPGMGAIDFAASTNPTATKIAATSVVFTDSPCNTASSSTTYAGILTLQ